MSGAEIAWDLDRPSGPSTADREFLRDWLHAALGGATNDNSGSHAVVPEPSSIFDGLPVANFDDGSGGIYWVGYPDALVPQNATPVVRYAGYSGGAAGVHHCGSRGRGQVIYFGFPFETLLSPEDRTFYMGRILEALSRPARLAPAGFGADGKILLSLSAEPGLTYRILRSEDLAHWTETGQVTTATGNETLEYSPVLSGNRFYRVSR